MSDAEFIPFCKRPEWSDVVPVDLTSLGGNVFKIPYSLQYKQVFGYYRAVQYSEECSKRLFDLTTEAIKLNPADYALWNHRRKLMIGLGVSLQDELSFLEKLMFKDSKIYQEWYHRMCVIKMLADPGEEMTFLEKILRHDAKNYHAWQHRVWLRQHFQNWNLFELETINQHISNDPYNNSAWSYRYQLIHNTNTFYVQQTLCDEISYTLKSIELFVDNESAWNYLSGILPFEKEDGKKKIINWALCFLSKLECNIDIQKKHRLAFDFIIHFYIDYPEFSTDDSTLLQKKLVNMLAQSIDTIRKGYWEYILED